MTEIERTGIKAVVAVLRGVCRDYGGHTIENIITQMESRVRENLTHGLMRGKRVAPLPYSTKKLILQTLHPADCAGSAFWCRPAETTEVSWWSHSQ